MPEEKKEQKETNKKTTEKEESSEEKKEERSEEGKEVRKGEKGKAPAISDEEVIFVEGDNSFQSPSESGVEVE